MEDILDIYAQSPQAGLARICFDERPCQLIADVYAPLPMQANQIAKQDYEYQRKGTCVALLAYDIDQGKRYIQIRDRRTKADYAAFCKEVIMHNYANYDKILLVQDNLNTHQYGSFYENLPAQEAHQMCKKIEFHFTPKHASWLNMAEIEFSVLSKQCLNRRIADKATMIKEVKAWQEQRNEKAIQINWTFTTQNARDKMDKHYQSFFVKN